MSENEANNDSFNIRNLPRDTREAWNRSKELWRWTRANPKLTRSEISHDIVRAYKTVLRRWILQVIIWFLLIGLVRLVWQIWGKIFDLIP